MVAGGVMIMLDDGPGDGSITDRDHAMQVFSVADIYLALFADREAVVSSRSGRTTSTPILSGRR